MAAYGSNITEIFLLGFHDIGNFYLLFLTLILMIYLLTICGNLLIITLVVFSKTLHTPMYIFLSQLSIADMILSSDIAPNMLIILQHETTFISFPGCLTQLYFFSLTEVCECLLLMMMSYDRYLAICFPLHYFSIMTHRLCCKFILTCWLLSIFISLDIIRGICYLHFCGPNTIDHFFCDFTPLLELSCSDVYKVQMEDTLLCIPVVVIPFFMIIGSYIKIVSAILKISSFSGRLKAFSTCSSHLTVVSIFYGTLIAMYMLPNKGQSLSMTKVLAMLYTIFTPFMNPLIYSLRNKDIKEACNNVFHNTIHSVR